MTSLAPRVQADTISRLERQVLAELASGRTNAQIAQRLGYSASYIKDVVAAARSRLSARDRAHAAALAVAGGLVVLGDDGSFVPTGDAGPGR